MIQNKMKYLRMSPLEILVLMPIGKLCFSNIDADEIDGGDYSDDGKETIKLVLIVSKAFQSAELGTAFARD